MAFKECHVSIFFFFLRTATLVFIILFLGTATLIGIGLIKWCGSLQRMDLSKLKSYYWALMTRGSHAFPWKSIWKVKVPSGVAYFTWTGYLTLDNLRRNIYIVNRCFMCKNNWESVGHLLLRCSYAYNLWMFVFSLFRVSWVMPTSLLE